MSELRYKRLEELRAEAAAELGKPLDADDVVTLAALRLSRENLIARLTSGAGDPERLSERLLTVGAAIKELSLSSPPTVELVITRGVLCPQCRAERPMTDEERSQPAPEHSRQSSPAPTLGAAHRENTPDAQASDCVASGRAPAVAKKPTVEPPLHERLAKDSRPDAPAPVNSSGSLVWFGKGGQR
jgi:hypothetical protein